MRESCGFFSSFCFAFSFYSRTQPSPILFSLPLFHLRSCFFFSSPFLVCQTGSVKLGENEVCSSSFVAGLFSGNLRENPVEFWLFVVSGGGANSRSLIFSPCGIVVQVVSVDFPSFSLLFFFFGFF